MMALLPGTYTCMPLCCCLSLNCTAAPPPGGGTATAGMNLCSTAAQDCTADPGSTLACTARPGGTPGGTYSCMVSVQLHANGFCGPKGALEGQWAGGAVLKVWAGDIDTQRCFLVLCGAHMYSQMQHTRSTYTQGLVKGRHSHPVMLPGPMGATHAQQDAAQTWQSACAKLLQCWKSACTQLVTAHCAKRPHRDVSLYREPLPATGVSLWRMASNTSTKNTSVMII